VVVVEDDAMTRGLVAETLEKAGFEVATASNGSDARRACKLVDPDGIILDVDLGLGPTGFDLADALLSEYPYLAILFLTNLPDARFAGRSVDSLPKGIGYLRKERLVQPGLLVDTLDAVLTGHLRDHHRDDRDPNRPLVRLSHAQISVLRMVALGMTNQQIADARGTTTRAVADVLARALRTIGTPLGDEDGSRVQAARAYMIAAGIPLGTRPPALPQTQL